MKNIVKNVSKKELEEIEAREAWLERRKNGVGASDSPNILGYTAWGSAITTYLDKTDQGISFDETERMKRGRQIESAIIEMFKEETGKRVRRLSTEIWSKEHPFLFATPDGMLIKEDAGLECKNVGVYDKSRWDGNVPDAYMIQCQHSMLVTGKSVWYLAALFSGNRFEYYKIDRDQWCLDHILSKTKKFWFENVKKGVIPEAQSNDGPTLSKIYEDQDDLTTMLSDDCIEMLNNLEDAKNLEKKWKDRKDEITNLMKQKLGNHKFGLVANKCVNWSRWETERFDTALFKKVNPELYRKYIKKGSSGKLTVTLKGD